MFKFTALLVVFFTAVAFSQTSQPSEMKVIKVLPAAKAAPDSSTAVTAQKPAAVITIKEKIAPEKIAKSGGVETALDSLFAKFKSRLLNEMSVNKANQVNRFSVYCTIIRKVAVCDSTSTNISTIVDTVASAMRGKTTFIYCCGKEYFNDTVFTNGERVYKQTPPKAVVAKPK